MILEIKKLKKESSEALISLMNKKELIKFCKEENISCDNIIEIAKKRNYKFKIIKR